jgi:signal peptidase I
MASVPSAALATAVAAPASSKRALWAATALAGLPVAVWFRDSMFGLARIHGTSMEPCLLDGDVVLIRKSDCGIVLDSLVNMIRGDSSSTSNNRDSEKARLVRSEMNRGLLNYAPVAKFYERPPAALTGHVVVYKSPLTAFPSQLCVKRVVGLGGQYVRNNNGGHGHGGQNSNNSSTTTTTRIISVPDYSLYVEGDNKRNSEDSRNAAHGSVSKNLLVGVAEYILWPPSRWQRIRREPAVDASGKPRSYWI